MLDRFLKSLIVCGIGLLVVFIILAIIIFVIKLVEYANRVDYSKLTNKIKKSFKKKNKEDITPEIVAVITSAIYTIIATENGTDVTDENISASEVPFKVRSIKRVK